MNSNKSQKKKGRKILYLHRHKLNSSSNKSLLSQSKSGISAAHKKRISSLLRNNKMLANEVQESREELSDMKRQLEAKNENSTKMMFVQSKMLCMHSTLKSFIKDFEETLQLLKQDDTSWPTLKYIIRSRDDFKNKMKNINDPIEEISERESSFTDPNTRHCSIGSKTFSDIFHSTPHSLNSKNASAVLQTELDKRTTKECNNLTTLSEDGVTCLQGNNKTTICEKITNLNSLSPDSHISKTPVLPSSACENPNGANLFDGKGNADDILPLREMEISLTPEFHLPCPSTKSDINLNSLHTFIPCGPSVTSSTQNDLNVSTTATCTSLSGKSKNSRIPRFQDLPVSVKKKTCLFMNANKTKPNYSGNILKSSADNAKLNSGSCPKKTFTQSAKFCTRSTNYDFSNKHSDQETNLTVINPNGIEAEDCHHRKTFVVPKSKNVADIEKPQNNRRKTFIKKSCATDQKNVSYGDKRKTFVVSKSNVKFIDDNKNCNTSFDESLSDSITLCNQNLTHSFDCNTKISSDLPIAPVLNTAVSVCSTEESNKNMQSTESLSEEIQNPAANQFQESQLGNEKMVNIPVINYIETPSVSSDKEFENFIHTVEKLNEQSIQNSSQELLTNHQNAVQNDINAVQNNFQKLNTSKYKNRENLFDSKGLNLQECGTNRNESVAKEKEYSQNSSELSQTPKLNKSHLPRKEQAKWYNFKFSSDSEGEMCNMDLNFDKPITLVKDPPTSESNVFHLDKNKPSLSTNKPHELEPAENTLKVQDEGDILTQSNSHTSSNIEMQNIQDTADIGIEICKKMKHYAEFNEENHEDKNHVSATKNKIYRKNSAQDIQDIMKIKKQPIKKKRLSVRFSEDSNVNENCASNIKSKACRNKTNKHAKLQKLAASKNLKTVDISEKAKNLTELDRKTNVPSFFPKEDSHCQTDTLSNDTNTHIYNQTEDAKGNKENLPVDEIKSKVSSLCPATDTSASCKSNVVSNDENISVCNETECLTDFDNFKSTRIAVVELNRSDVEIDVPKKSKRKRKFPDDPVPSDDCLSLKRTKVTNSKEVDKCINPPEITSDKAKKGENFEKKCAENETVNKKTNRRKKVQSNNENIYLPDNIIHVQAEVHPPPSFVNMSPISFPSVKNTKIDEKEQTKRLSVVLSDVLQSKDIIHLNIISNEEKTHISSKIPSSENHSDQTTTVVKNEAETDQNSNCVNEGRTTRKLRANKISYKEPPLNLKLRR